MRTSHVSAGACLVQGRVYGMLGHNDPNCCITVGVMFWFACFSVVFFWSQDLHKEEETMVFEAHGMSFPCTELLLFNYAKVKTVFYSMAPLKDCYTALIRSTVTGNTSHKTGCTCYIVRRLTTTLILVFFFFLLRGHRSHPIQSLSSPEGHCSYQIQSIFRSDGGSAPRDNL